MLYAGLTKAWRTEDWLDTAHHEAYLRFYHGVLVEGDDEVLGVREQQVQLRIHVEGI